MKTLQHSIFSINLSEKGFTIVELSIAVTLALFITGVTYMAYITQQRSYVSQEQVGEMQSSTQVSLSMLTRDIREAGFGVPTKFNINGETQIIRVEDNKGINNSDRLFLVGGFRQVSELDITYQLKPGKPVTVKDGTKMGTFSTLAQWTSEQNNNRENQQYGRHNISLLGMMMGTVIGVNEQAKTLSIVTDGNLGNPSRIEAGSPIYIVEDIIYQIEKRQQNGIDIYELVRWNRNKKPNHKTTIAENIENMQVRLLDGNRRAEIHLLAKTEGEDPIFVNQGKQLAFDDVTATWHEVGTTDSYRRRLIVLSVALRN